MGKQDSDPKEPTVKHTAAALNAMSQHDLANLVVSMGIGKATILVKVRSGQPHKRITAPKSHLVDMILRAQQ